MITSRRSNGRGQTIFVLTILAIVGFIIWQFIAFQYAMARMPQGWTVAQMPVAGQTPQEVVLKLRPALSQTIALHYHSEVVALAPQDVDFSLNVTGTVEMLNQARAEAAEAGSFTYFLFRRTPPPRDVPIVATLSEEKLRTFLARVSERYDQPPTAPAPLVDELRFVPGQSGTELDISGSVPIVSGALRSATAREINLVVKEIPPISPKLTLLRDMYQAFLKRRFDGEAGIFVKDLRTGEEIGINEGVAFSGMSMLKVPIMAETYRRTNGLPDEATLQAIAEVAKEPSNEAANTLLQRLGDGDAYTAADRLNLSLKYLGLLNTFIATPYDQTVAPIAIVTRANSQGGINANPDPRMQTTPEDMGLLLEMLYFCSHDSGTLVVAYPGAFTRQKCTQMLDLMSQATLTDPASATPLFIRAGLPAGTRLANKWGFDAETRANAAIVSTPNGDFVIALFLHKANWGDWQLASPLMADLAQAAYTYFQLPHEKR